MLTKYINFIAGSKLEYIMNKLKISELENLLISELDLSSLESKIFLLIVFNGKMSVEEISNRLGLDTSKSLENITSLIQLNMIIQYSQNLYECFHPKFAVVNRYRRLCNLKNIVFKKNLVIDNIGTILEKPFNDARTI